MTVRLVERRAVVRRLARADAAALAADWSHAVEVVPTARPGRYRLTARGWVGTFATHGRTFEIAPKLGWPVASVLLGGGRVTEGGDLGRDLRSALAVKLAELLTERMSAGLVRGYAEQPAYSATVRGRIDFAATARRVGDLAVVADEFTADMPWNGWPLHVAGRLLAGPLTPDARHRLGAVCDGVEGIQPHPSPPAATADPRPAAYRPLLSWCSQVERALDGGGLLLNLERLFESHLSHLLGSATESQTPLLVRGPAGTPGVELRPDFLIRGVTVWDAKWKPLPVAGPAPDDLHQALGYAAALGLRSAGLVYPGRRYRVAHYTTPSGVRVTVATCRLVGDPARVRAAGERLRRLMVRP